MFSTYIYSSCSDYDNHMIYIYVLVKCTVLLGFFFLVFVVDQNGDFGR